jgi:bifunctional UDP-N-acetylglucosamine pyrophosphorylase/glucosamine-1-phosphate N-acetyltransferase
MIAPIVLAAGNSTRFQDPKTKLLHKLDNVAIVKRVVVNLINVGFTEINIVTGHQECAIKEELDPEFAVINTRFITQDVRLGTAHAVMQCRDFVRADDILVVFGDKPLFTPQTIKEFISYHENITRKQPGGIMTIATVEHPNPDGYSEGYGTVVRHDGKVIALRKIEGTTECDAALYLFNANWLWENIHKLSPHKDNQFFLPDMVELAYRQGLYVGEYRVKNHREAVGINTKEQFQEALGYLKGGK